MNAATYSTYRVVLSDGTPTSIVEPTYSDARYMAEIRWPGATVVDPREYKPFVGAPETPDEPASVPPLARAISPDEKTFWTKVEKTDTCWLWTGSMQVKGYGRMQANNRQVLAHRWSYERFVGPIPDGMQIDHLCRVRHCVNPDHLEAVSPGENTRRGSLGRKDGKCLKGHDIATVGLRREGKRTRCAECARINDRYHYWRKKAEAAEREVLSLDEVIDLALEPMTPAHASRALRADWAA